RSTKRALEQNMDQPQPSLFGTQDAIVHSHDDAKALLGLFYFRRILDHQAITLCVRHLNPLTHFFEATTGDLQEFFSTHVHLRGYVDAAQLTTSRARAGALRYADRHMETMVGRLRLARERDFPDSVRRSRFPVEWLFW